MERGESLALAAGGASMSALRAVARGATALRQGASASWLDDGRLFLQHGPINLVVRADGPDSAVRTGYAALIERFPDWLGALVGELERLRSAEHPALTEPHGAIARRMVNAVRACGAGFVTPMAAVAGAVADEAVAVLAARPGIERCFVNNGGDIALHLTPRRSLAVGVVPSLRSTALGARIVLDARSPIRGVATSGWAGRSHSLGIADAVTVLARDAARADAAATLVANAVDVAHPAIERVPASVLDQTSDLGERLVTVTVPPLPTASVEAALDAGLALARALQGQGTIAGAGLTVQGRWRTLGLPALVDGART